MTVTFSSRSCRMDEMSATHSSILRACVVQLASNDQRLENLNRILSAIQLASTDGATAVFFPENSLYFRLDPADAFGGIELDGIEIRRIQQLADAYKMTVHLGAFPLKTSGDGIARSNASVIVCPNSAPIIAYQKIHLFDIALKGNPPIRESEFFERGASLSSVSIGNWSIGSSICYDVRFPELYLQQGPVDLILVPSAFLVKTGKAHWHTLLRARAIENQSFLIAAAQMSPNQSPSGAKSTYGHSLVIDPWGEIVADLGSEPSPNGFRHLTVDLEKSKLSEVREQIPMQQHRRERLWNPKF